MSGGKTYPYEDLPESYFSGQKHITREPDEYPDLDQILNSLRIGGTIKVGTVTIGNGTSSQAVAFTTQFPAGSTVKVFLTPIQDMGAAIRWWAASEAVTGFTATTDTNVTGDKVLNWIALIAWDP